MSTRNLVYEALVLRSRESPGGDRILSLMTAEAGVVDVFVFGGPKSKLRSLASTYVSGRAFVYLDPVKDFRKLSDFEVGESFPALRDQLGRLWAAGLVAELLLKTSGGGGDFPAVLGLARDCLGALDAGGGREDYALVLFLWRFVALIGLGPDPACCSRCGAPLAPGAVYRPGAEGLTCPACASRAEDAFPFPAGAGGAVRLSPGALRWLRRSEGLGFAEALRVSVDSASLAALKALAFGLARGAAEAPLAAFTVGAGLA